jgi:hypothetical protein
MATLYRERRKKQTATVAGSAGTGFRTGGNYQQITYQLVE